MSVPQARVAHHVACLSPSSVAPAAAEARVVLVVGAGVGIGQAVCHRFAKEGFVVVAVRRKGKEELDALVEDVRRAGGQAHARLCDAGEPDQLVRLVGEVEDELGPVEVAVYNIGANMGVLRLQDTPVKKAELAWKIGALGAFVLCKELGPRMAKRGRGTLLLTGATAGVRGNKGQHAHSMAMHARRGLAQSLAHELWPKGVHVCHCIVDGLVDSPGTVGKVMPEVFKAAKDKLDPIGGIVKPSAVADTYWHLHAQPRNAWTFEVDLRPWRETAWFNTD